MLHTTTKAEFSNQDVAKGDLSMASKFFHVPHEFRAGKAQQWWETAQAAMAPGGGWDEVVAENLEAGLYNHLFCPSALKALPSASLKSAKELQRRSCRNLSMALMA